MRIRRREELQGRAHRRYVLKPLLGQSRASPEVPRESKGPSAAQERHAEEKGAPANAPSPSPAEIRQEGYQQGLREGYERGFQEGVQRAEAELTAQLEEHFNSLLSALKEGAEAIVQARDETVERMEAWIPRAALLLSEYVLQRELSQDKGALLELLQRALRELRPTGPVKVHLSPADYERLAEQPPEVWNTDHLTFVPDEAVSPGGAIVETDSQVVDARLESRLLEAARHLLFPEEIQEEEPRA
ncbi:MAG: hypothetical protein KatS3mg115_1574 [Candidatus Poribacteria bacterium]|nr:MAG: hypothetical protein KatS3mg115_1574 [Candidatus Poribacteria bacterium]